MILYTCPHTNRYSAVKYGLINELIILIRIQTPRNKLADITVKNKNGISNIITVSVLKMEEIGLTFLFSFIKADKMANYVDPGQTDITFFSDLSVPIFRYFTKNKGKRLWLVRMQRIKMDLFTLAILKCKTHL